MEGGREGGREGGNDTKEPEDAQGERCLREGGREGRTSV